MIAVIDFVTHLDQELDHRHIFEIADGGHADFYEFLGANRGQMGSSAQACVARKLLRAAAAMLSALTPKKARNAARVSLRPKPSVPRLV